MHIRSFLKIAALVIMSLSLNACTHKLFNKIDTREDKKYKESIDQILISEKGEYVAIVGTDYYYLINMNGTRDVSGKPELLEFLSSDKVQPFLLPDIGDMKIDLEGNIELSLRLKLNTNDKKIQKKADQLGFSQRTDRTRTYSEDFQGKKYSRKAFKLPLTLPLTLQKINGNYQISIEEKQSTKGKKILYVLTPVTVVADAVLFPILAAGVLICFSGNGRFGNNRCGI